MNLDDSAKVAQEIEERNRKKRLVIISIILCMILMAGLGIMIFFIVLKDNSTLKIYTNGVERKIPAQLFIDDKSGVKYVNVNSMASLLGINYTKGKYKVYDEDENSCYLTSLHEVVALTVGDTTYSKFLIDESESQAKAARAQNEIKTFGQGLTLASPQGTEEVYVLKYPIQSTKNGIYVSFDDIGTIFNMKTVVENEYRIRFYTYGYYYASALKTATKLGYPVPSYFYENMRGLVDNFFVAGESASKVGVINTKTSSVSISCTYDKLIYLQNANEFFVYVNNSCALFASDGKAIIKPSEFDDISVLDQGKTTDDRLYMVRKNNKYGVLNRKGDIIIHPEYDFIGLDPRDYSRDATDKNILDEVTNTKVLFDKIIPVKLSGKYGLYGIDGTEYAPIQYDGLGFAYTSSVVSNMEKKPVSGQTGTILIPESLGIKGIVMKRSEGYGIFDAEKGKLIIPTNNSEIYKLLKGGVTTYYMVFNGEASDLEKYIKDNKLISVKEQPKTQVQDPNGAIYEQPVDLNGNVTNTTSTNNTNNIDTEISNESYIQYTPTEITNVTTSTNTTVPMETVPLY